jgi:acyl-CoA reductase-like NAD-dependent aldehyde dehydrogenase
LWIQGQEISAQNGETFPVYDPGRGAVAGYAARGGAADVDRAVDSARQAFRSKEWRGLNPYERGRLLWALARKIEAEKEQIAWLLSLENGKPLKQAYDEVGTTIRNFEYYSGWADKIHGRVVPVPADVFDYILYEPLGVVGHIIPWNYPLDIFARGVAPCLAVGNTVVAKPAEETPLSTVAIARLASEVGFPAGAINVVTGLGLEAGASLAAHPGIQGLAFCGSVEAGKQVLATAARQITPVVSLELGGKSPCLVFPDADIQRAAESAAKGICYNTGQSCGALSRLLVPEDLVGVVVDKAKAVMAETRLGRGHDDPDMGPLVSKEQLERVLGYVETGRQEGATLLYGGRKPGTSPLSEGYFIEPTLFTNVKPGMRIVEEEIFGPVMGILTFESEEEAIELANASSYGLSAEIWTRDLSRAHRVAAQLDVSHVTVNGGGGFGVEAPFGGVKQSGFGREGGFESILQYSRVKNIWINL